MAVGFFAANTTMAIDAFVDESGTSSSSNQLKYTVPTGRVFVGMIHTASGGTQTGVSGGGNAPLSEGLNILGEGTTVRIISNGVTYVITGVEIKNTP